MPNPARRCCAIAGTPPSEKVATLGCCRDQGTPAEATLSLLQTVMNLGRVKRYSKNDGLFAL